MPINYQYLYDYQHLHDYQLSILTSPSISPFFMTSTPCPCGTSFLKISLKYLDTLRIKHEPFLVSAILYYYRQKINAFLLHNFLPGVLT